MLLLLPYSVIHYIHAIDLKIYASGDVWTTVSVNIADNN